MMMRFTRLLIAATCLAPAALVAQSPVVNVANNRAAPPPALDSAISRLQSFLTTYPNSPLRPNALFQLGELLVRQADEAFAASQRSGSATAGDTAVRAPVPTPAPARAGTPPRAATTANTGT
jgi:hypothetical protein